ncbi:PREDICTED: hemicentin-1-like [Chinchilla lanigera]|uniref:hemicentin-1-like n=1 Tax=Chinchilla lanigera TaxID=34839 RepID=UPI000699244B|nr:PREDICTED: hemicentin-1-like [Chinchilla lanigera]
MCVAQNSAGTALGKIKLNIQVPPVISTHPKEYVIAVDKPILLPCETDGLPPPDITWHKDGHVILESIRQRILNSGALQIAFAQPDDTGQYTCMAANVAGSSSISAKLIVHVPPRIRSTEAHYTVNENSQAVLPCVAEGIPTPAINWKKNNIPLTDLLGKHTAQPYGELILENVVLEDSGVYTCVANNAAGEDIHSISLTVNVLPTFTELPGDVSLNKGEQLRLSCKATGIPLPKLTWTFNNNIIPAHFDSVNGHSELVIEKVSKEDSGTYVCTAENSVGFVKAIGFVYVKEPPVFKGDYPSNWIEPLGSNAILNCEVKGDPAPTIQWSRKGVDIEISHRIRQLGNGSLAIYGTVNEDAGDYTCVATNEAGVVERSMSLTLQSPPVITLEPVETIVNAGGKVRLDCQATGEPQPTITWSRQGHSIPWDDRVSMLPNNSLHIAAAQKEDTSEYECVARNLMGSVLVRVPVIIQVHGGFSPWSAWGPCSVTCGNGNQKRTRSCGYACTATESRTCDRPNCPGIEDTFRTAATEVSLLAGSEEFNATKLFEVDTDSCERWMSCKSEFLKKYMHKVINDLPSCPCSYPTEVAYSTADIFDRIKRKDFRWKDASGPKEKLEIYKPTARYCIRSMLSLESTTLAAQHCCYGDNMQLITRGKGAGTPNLISTEFSAELHYKVDVLPWIICKGDWSRYNEARPPNNGQKCTESPSDEDYIKQFQEAREY